MNTEHKDIVEDKEIDLLELVSKVWKKRIFILKISLIGAVLGLIVAFSIPKEYSTTVVLAPEASPSNFSGGMGALAAMAGINLQQNSKDAISPDLYPSIATSTPFLIGLFDIQVVDQKSNINTDLYTYINKEQKSAWWGYIFGLPSKILGLFSSSKQEEIVQDTISSSGIKLTSEQYRVLGSLKSRIDVSVDKKTGVISLSSTMQSADISAYVADTITSYLQNYIIEYRTQKARQDLVFTEKLYGESKESYYKAQQKYASFLDGNLDIISARYGTTKERLQNEMSLAFTVYNQMAQQLQLAKVKVQDTTPVYTIIQPAVTPLIPIKPNKKLILLGFIFIAFVGSCSWVIAKDYYLNQIKK